MEIVKKSLMAFGLLASLSACEATPPSEAVPPIEEQGVNEAQHTFLWFDETDSWEEKLKTITIGTTTTYQSTLTYPKLPKELSLAWMGIRSNSCLASIIDSKSNHKTLKCEIDDLSGRLKVTVTGREFCYHLQG